MQWCWRSGPECASEILSRRRANQAVPPPEARIAHLSNLPEHGGCCGMDVALILGNRACLGASSRWRVRSRVRDVTASGEIEYVQVTRWNTCCVRVRRADTACRRAKSGEAAHHGHAALDRQYPEKSRAALFREAGRERRLPDRRRLQTARFDRHQGI